MDMVTFFAGNKHSDCHDILLYSKEGDAAMIISLGLFLTTFSND